MSAAGTVRRQRAAVEQAVRGLAPHCDGVGSIACEGVVQPLGTIRKCAQHGVAASRAAGLGRGAHVRLLWPWPAKGRMPRRAITSSCTALTSSCAVISGINVVEVIDSVPRVTWRA